MRFDTVFLLRSDIVFMYVICFYFFSLILYEVGLGYNFGLVVSFRLGIILFGVGDGFLVDWGDELDGEGFLLGVDVSVICRDKGVIVRVGEF